MHVASQIVGDMDWAAVLVASKETCNVVFAIS